MAKKIQLQDVNGNVLHPLTLGECVIMNSGENLDTLMSKSQMFTPTITQDKSMFKVGTGVDVDYSANVKDGAYESLVFKGKSLVNLVRNTGTKLFSTSGLGKINKTETSRGMIYETSREDLDTYITIRTGANPMLKPNTSYTIFFEIVQNTIIKDGQSYKGVTVCGTNDSYYNRATNQLYHNSNFSLDKGVKSILVTTGSDVSSYDGFGFGFPPLSSGGVEQGQVFEIQNVMVIEGDCTNQDVPYFEGLCDSKMPILRNVGKNLFDLSRMNEKVFAGGGSPNIINLTDNSLTTTNNNNATSGYGYVITNLKKGVPYRLTVTNDSVSTGIANFNVSKRDGNSWHEQRIISIPIGNTASRIIYADNSTLNLSVNIITNGANGQFTAVLKNIQIEEVSSENDLSTPYEDYKTNILRTSEEIVLREVNGVQDTYNPLTGEYVCRIGEVVITSAVAKSVVVLDKNVRVNIAMSALNGDNGTTKANNILSDKFYWSEANARDIEGLRVNGNTLHWCISRDKLTSQDLQGVNTWLQSNPITVQYILAEPVTTIVKPSTITPFAYQNGHVIVESGFEGQSLLPEIEYSVVTGRTGQVTQNTKVLRQQEQQIIGLEELLLTQVVQMEYERTLLQFDYELQMMMLG